jgi:hypothetical protein
MQQQKINTNKNILFERLLSTNAFWSLQKNNLSVDMINDDLLIETIFIHGDVEDLIMLFNLFDFEKLINVWHTKLISDNRYYKLNYFLATCFFKITNVNDYIRKYALQNSRYEKLKLFTNRN